jgi:hypothetical protein
VTGRQCAARVGTRPLWSLQTLAPRWQWPPASGRPARILPRCAPAEGALVQPRPPALGSHRRARRGVQVRGKSVYLQYSLRQEITGTRGGGDAPSNVLIVAVENLEVRLLKRREP